MRLGSWWSLYCSRTEIFCVESLWRLFFCIPFQESKGAKRQLQTQSPRQMRQLQAPEPFLPLTLTQPALKPPNPPRPGRRGSGTRDRDIIRPCIHQREHEYLIRPRVLSRAVDTCHRHVFLISRFVLHICSSSSPSISVSPVPCPV